MAVVAPRHGGLSLTTNIVAAVVAIPAPWAKRDLLRFLRLAGTGVAAVCGATASLLIGAFAAGPIDASEAAWVCFAIVIGGTASWICELRSSSESAAEAARLGNERHAELIAATARLEARLADRVTACPDGGSPASSSSAVGDGRE